jgi:ribonuclease R
LKCEFLQDKLGQEYTGRISSVTSFGIFVELDQVYVEGLVHVTALKNDYYRFDATKHRLIGEHSRTIYRLGDSVKVRVANVNLDDRKIDLDLID